MADIKRIKCSRCGKTKLLNEFYPNKNSKNGYDGWCKQCHRTRTIKKGIERQSLLSNIKEYAGCAFCGTRKSPVLLFHHVNPSVKSFSIGRGHYRGLKSLFVELGKTIVLCCNCHAELHYNMGRYLNDY